MAVPKVNSFVKEERSKSLFQRQNLHGRARFSCLSRGFAARRSRACTPFIKSEEKGGLLAVYDEQDASDVVISKNPEYLKFWELPVTHDVNVSSKFDSF